MNIEQILTPGVVIYLFICFIFMAFNSNITENFKDITVGQIIACIPFLPGVVIISVVLVVLLLIGAIMENVAKAPLLNYKPFKRRK